MATKSSPNTKQRQQDDSNDASYPSLFNQISSTSNPQTISLRPIVEHLAGIPLIDLQRLDAHQLDLACRNWGIFRIADHGVPSGLFAELQRRAKEVLALPFDQKTSQPLSPFTYFWGTPTIGVKVKNINWHEGLHVLLNHLVSGPVGEPLESLLSLRSLVDEYGKHLARISRTIFNVIASNLKLDSEQTASYLSEFDGIFRIYRYPKCTDTSSFYGLEAHTDSSVLSIVHQDEVGGLQIFHENTWLHIAPIPDTLIINLGDMMQAMSSDEYKSVEHRVVVNNSKERMSICYFANPGEESLITSSTYRPFTHNEFKNQVQQDIKATGYKVGLKQFRI